ncbi:SHOCT domain-containing protein [candidate division KSB1 bacterium]
MSSSFGKSIERIAFWAVIAVVIDLFTSHELTWSKWVIMGCVVMLILRFRDEGDEGSKSIRILKERYAKGEISEEEFLKLKEQVNKDQRKKLKPAGNYLLGLILVLVGGLLILNNLSLIVYPLPWLPLLLIVIGLFAIFSNI